MSTNTDTDPPTFDSEFYRFVLDHPQWDSTVNPSLLERVRSFFLPQTSTKPILFFQAHTHLSTLTLLRRQRSGLCCVHAPAVLQHYLCCIDAQGESAGVLDVEAFVRDHWESNRAKYGCCSYNERGGDALQILHTITGRPYLAMRRFVLSINLPFIHCKKDCQSIAKRLKTKPALISRFRVDRDFQTSHRVSFHGRVDRVHCGLHAMLLIGARVDPNTGEHWFLLQNWWTGRFFIEVSWQYLSSSECSIYFVEENIVEGIPAEFARLYNMHYAETSMDVEEFFEEM